MPIIYWKDGTSNNVPESDVNYWISQGWSLTNPTQATTSPFTPQTGMQQVTQPVSGSPTDIITIYGPGGSTMDVMRSDLGYWQSQGWSMQTPTTSTTGDMVTLYDPLNQPRQVPANQVDYYISQGYTQQSQDVTQPQQPPTTQPPTAPGEPEQPQGTKRLYHKHTGEIQDVPLYQWESFVRGEMKYNFPQEYWSESPVQIDYVYGEDVLNKKANNAAVNHLYNQYFGRDATQAELDNWGEKGGSDTTVRALEDFLRNERFRYGLQSGVQLPAVGQFPSIQPSEPGVTPEEPGITPEEQPTVTPEEPTVPRRTEADIQTAIDYINNSDLPEELKQIYRNIIYNYPEGMEFDTEIVLEEFERIKNETIDPYYQELTDIAMRDFEDAKRLMEERRGAEVQLERATEEQEFDQAQRQLEAAGATFTGRAIKELGAQAAYRRPTTGQESAIPSQIPFGGEYREGYLPQAQRLRREASQREYQAGVEQLGKQLETQLGTGVLTGTGLQGYQPIGGITGTQERQKQQQYGQTLQQLIENRQAQQQYSRNITF